MHEEHWEVGSQPAARPPPSPREITKENLWIERGEIRIKFNEQMLRDVLRLFQISFGM